MKNINSLTLMYCVLLLFASCMSDTSSENQIIGAIDVEKKEQIDIAKYINPDQPLAYIDQVNPYIYVAKGYEEEVATELGAEVNGDIWMLKEENFTKKRTRKELKWEDYYPKVSIIIWTYMKGFKCKEIPKGTWLNVTNKKNKFLRSYQTTQKDWWCIRDRSARCKIVIKKITGDFYTRPNGKGRKKLETRRLSFCTP